MQRIVDRMDAIDITTTRQRGSSVFYDSYGQLVASKVDGVLNFLKVGMI